jgi:hypothetical protein
LHHTPQPREFDTPADYEENLVSRTNHYLIELTLFYVRFKLVKSAHETFHKRIRQQNGGVTYQRFAECITFDIAEPVEQEVHGQKRAERRESLSERQY